MTRYLFIALPNLELEQFPAQESPFALTHKMQRQIRIHSCNRHAKKAGIKEGQSLSQAHQCVPHLQSLSLQPLRTKAFLTYLLAKLSRYTPNLHHYDRQGIWLEISTTSHLFHGEKHLIQLVGQDLESLALTYHIAITDSLGGSYALAHHMAHDSHCALGRCETLSHINPDISVEQTGKNTCLLVSEGRLAQVVAPLPISLLRLTKPQEQRAQKLGFHHIRDLYNVPRNTLAKRFPAGKKHPSLLQRLDQILGHERDQHAVIQLQKILELDHHFMEPVKHLAPLIEQTSHLAEALCQLLKRADKGVNVLDLFFISPQGHKEMITTHYTIPSQNPNVLMRLIQETLKNRQIEDEIETIKLKATKTSPIVKTQMSFASSKGFHEGPNPLEDSTPNEKLSQLIDRLCNRLGADQVMRITYCNSHIPEDAVQYQTMSHQKARQLSPRTGMQPALVPPTPNRPCLLFTSPEPIDVIAETLTAAPFGFTWRKVKRRIINISSPERITGQWWNLDQQDHPRPRDYYKVEDDQGCRFWIFRHGLYLQNAPRPQWFLHGLFS